MELFPGRWKVGAIVYIVTAAILGGVGLSFENDAMTLVALLFIAPVGYYVWGFATIFTAALVTLASVAVGADSIGVVAEGPVAMVGSAILVSTLFALGALANVVALRMALEMTRGLCRWRTAARG